MKTIDINSDMGESFGPWVMGEDLKLLNHVTSANIACGFHAGDPDTMLQTVRAAIEKDVAIGAHPGLPDLQGFGRRVMAMSADEIYSSVLYQVSALRGIAESQGGKLHHVKTHGALYTMTARDPALARAVARAVFDIDPALPIYVANQAIAQAAHDYGLTAVFEVYADRGYQDDGTLTPRGQPGAMIEDIEQSIAQVLGMVEEGVVRSVSGKAVPIRADTLCIHGDQPGATAFAARIRAALEAKGVAVRTI